MFNSDCVVTFFNDQRFKLSKEWNLITMSLGHSSMHRSRKSHAGKFKEDDEKKAQ